ncbi:MAG: DMT family transporter [Bacteroidales bacterium]
MIKMNGSYLKIILAAIIWGSSGVFIKFLNLHPFVITFFRVAVPVLLIGVFTNWKNLRIIRLTSGLLVFASFLNVIRLVFYFIGFLNAPIGNAVIILYTWPIFAVLLSRLYLFEPLPLKNILLLVLAFSGIVLIHIDKQISFDNDEFIGTMAMLLSSVFYAITVVIFKKESPAYSNWSIVFHQNFIGALVFTVIFLFYPEKPPLDLSLVAFLYAILVGVIGFGLFFSALKEIKASNASLVAYIEVISAVIFGIVFFNETLSWNVIGGGILIIGSSMLLKK